MKEKEKSSKKFLALLLSLLMSMSVVTAFTACDEEESSNTTTEEETEDDDDVVVDDEELITNSTFELNKYDAKKPIITSTTGWSRSTNSVASGTAVASEAASGIIDVEDEKWKDLTTTGIDVAPEELTEEQAKEKWSSMTTKDKLEYYEAWKDDTANKDKSISDLEFYESFNIDVDDLPFVEDADGNKTAIDNPLSRPQSEDSRVLMIHNEKKTDTYIGTAQKFTSNSTVTVKSGETAQFSVWVKTSNLVGSSANNEEDATAHNKGAYIRVNHTVGGKTLEPLEIKNINVNDWTQYTFVLKAASFADSTFSIVLGLGQSGGTNKEEYVNGYAFFDDVECTVSKTAVDVTDYTVLTFDNETASEKTFAVNKKENAELKKFALDFNDLGNSFTSTTASDFVGEATTDDNNPSKQIYTTVDRNHKFGVPNALPVPALNGKYLSTEHDINEYVSNLKTALQADGIEDAIYENHFKDDDFIGDEGAYLIYSKGGAAYKATKTLTIGEDYSAISFYVKTSEMKSYTGAGIRLEFEKDDIAGVTEIAKIDTTTVVDEDADTDGWQRILLFFHNETGSTQKATLTLTFGPTSDLRSATSASFYAGWAAFAKFEEDATLTKEEFDCAASGSYSKIITMETPEEESQVDAGFDSAGSLEQFSIKNGYANAKNYTGVYDYSAYVGGKTTEDGQDALATNQLSTAGLLNRQYASNYTAILEEMGGTGATWNSVIGEGVTQPLVIYNNKATSTNAYGFIGNSVSLTASTYKTVSMRVKVSQGAQANIYLVDTSDDNYNALLSIGRNVTYWYDKDGNVCAKDPTDDKFNSKTDVAFRLQDNGLYKVNPKWSGAEGIDTERYFANLKAYELDGDTKNLLLDDLATDYEYNDNWRHDGNDRIAFYSSNDEQTKAYAYSDKTTEVYDFSTVSALPVRYAAESAKAMHITVDNTDGSNGDWQIVTFYLHTGESVKNYRLEVWHGTRDGETGMAANSYVMFDSWSPETLTSTTWETMLKELDEGATKMESAFSFYDTAKYFRYDETLDENQVGNVYESYDATASTEIVTYLQSADKYTIFADYSALETAVAKDVVEEETEEEEEEETENETNVWLLASSIAIAVVLLIAIVSLIVRKIVVKRRKQKGIPTTKKK